MSVPGVKNCSEAEMTELMQAVLLLFLFAGAVQDVQKQEIPVLLLAGGFGAGLLLRILSGSGDAAALFAGCLPGLLLLAAAFLSGEAVGYGDGGMLICTGMYLTLSENLMLMVMSLFLAAGGAGILLFTKKIKRRESLPFLPFLLGGYVLLLAG